MGVPCRRVDGVVRDVDPAVVPGQQVRRRAGLVREDVVVHVHGRGDQPAVVAAADVGERLPAVVRLPDVDRVHEQRVRIVRIDGEAHVVPHLRRVLTARAGRCRPLDEAQRACGSRPATTVVPPLAVRQRPRKQPRLVVSPRTWSAPQAGCGSIDCTSAYITFGLLGAIAISIRPSLFAFGRTRRRHVADRRVARHAAGGAGRPPARSTRSSSATAGQPLAGIEAELVDAVRAVLAEVLLDGGREPARADRREDGRRRPVVTQDEVGDVLPLAREACSSCRRRSSAAPASYEKKTPVFVPATILLLLFGSTRTFVTAWYCGYVPAGRGRVGGREGVRAEHLPCRRRRWCSSGSRRYRRQTSRS